MEPSLYRKILHDRRDLYETALQDGLYTPFLLPWDFIPVMLLLMGVMLTPRLSHIVAKTFRWLIVVSIISYEIYRWPQVRTIGLAVGYGIGLSGFWGVVMSFNLLIFHDPGKDFRRIEYRKDRGTFAASRHARTNRRNDFTHGTTATPSPSKSSFPQENRTLVWQNMPSSTYHLLDWTLDLVTSFRGINWNFRIPIKTYKALPPDEQSLEMSEAVRKSNDGALEKLQKSALVNTMVYYLILDLFKTFLMTDPYWLGIASVDSPSSWPWLASLDIILPGATKFVRLAISIASVVSALSFIFSLNPLFFATILPYFMGDDLYKYTSCPLTEAWLYPPQWGNMLECLCNKGLAGMWGAWWHQMFRYGISEPSRLLIEKLKLNARGQVARFLQLSIAFLLTGGIHAVASSTTFSLIPGQPLRPLLFFILQAVGVTLQTETSRLIVPSLRLQNQRRLRQVTNLLFVAAWLWVTGPLLADDFARCGIWLFEPVPVSLFRGLGFGPGDCWSPWLQYAEGSKWLGWYRGKNWYTTGIAIY